MAVLKVKNLQAENVGEIEMADDIFGLKINNELVHQVFVAQAANLRSAIAHTKNRGERAGSGRKPWKQKGTGRARVGSVRTPVWRGGGVVFGPTNQRNFKKSVNKKMSRLATRMAIASKIQSGEMVVLENFIFPDNKTKSVANFLKKAGLKGSFLWTFNREEQEAMRACRNLEKTKISPVNSLNVLDILSNRYLVISRQGAEFLNNFFAEKKNKIVVEEKKLSASIN